MAIKPVEILITAKDKASSVFGSLKATAIGAGIAIAGYFGIRLFSSAVEGAAALEAKLSEVKGVAGATADEMVLLRKAAEDAGATTKFSAEEGADALGNLARAGLSVKDSIAALPPTLALAQAGQIGLAESAEIVTRTLAGFNLEADQSGRIADVLAAGANASNTSVLGLAQALSYAAPTAVSLGLSLETTVAIIGKFADAGIDASRAGTALNAILSQFSDPASKFRQELAAMGIVTNDFEDALRQLAASGPAGQKAVLAVGTEAGPALRALLNQGIGALDELKAKLDDSAGSASEFARIVEDNLTGAASGFGSAWDTVKVALATPVLPILKSGIEQLTGALREAVANGTVAKFGDAIAKGFQSALTWARSFINEVDFGAMAAKASAAADQVNAAFTTLETYATNAGNSVKLFWGIATGGASGAMLAIYKVGEAFTGVAADILLAGEKIFGALSKVSFGPISDAYKAAADQMAESSGGLRAASEALAAKATESFTSMADGAQLARDGWAGLTATGEEASQRAFVAMRVYDDLSETLKEVGGDAEATGQKAKAAAILQTEAARQTRVEVEALKREYEAALQAGDVQTALGKLQQMQDKLRQTSDQAQTTGQDVANAFERMGVQTKGALKQAAENAKRDFDLIKGSGQATADGLQQAFQRYAEAAIAANGGVATASVQAEAGMRGLEIVTDATGKSIVRAMADAKTATEGAGNAANGAAGGYRNMAQAAGQAAEAAKQLAENNKRYGRPGEAPTSRKDPGRGSPYARPGQAPRNADGQTQAEFQRTEKLAGQGATDERLRFELLQKMKSGTLTEADVTDLKNVVAVLKQNQAIFDSLPIGLNGLSALEDDRKWNAARTGFEQAIAKFSGGSGGSGAAGVGRTVIFKLDTGSGIEEINTDEAGARAMVRGLTKAARRAGR